MSNEFLYRYLAFAFMRGQLEKLPRQTFMFTRWLVQVGSFYQCFGVGMLRGGEHFKAIPLFYYVAIF